MAADNDDTRPVGARSKPHAPFYPAPRGSLAASHEALKSAAYGLGHRASGIAAICELLGEQLFSNPDTARIAEAVTAVGVMANGLASEILDLAEDAMDGAQ